MPDGVGMWEGAWCGVAVRGYQYGRGGNVMKGELLDVYLERMALMWS